MKRKNNYFENKNKNLLHRLLLEAMLKEDDPLFRQINISRLKLQKDLKQCFVYYTFISSLTKVQENNLQKKLDLQSNVWRQKIAPKWKLRFLPKLVFINDHSLLKLEEITKIFSSLQKKDKEE